MNGFHPGRKTKKQNRNVLDLSRPLWMEMTCPMNFGPKSHCVATGSLGPSTVLEGHLLHAIRFLLKRHSLRRLILPCRPKIADAAGALTATPANTRPPCRRRYRCPRRFSWPAMSRGSLTGACPGTLRPAGLHRAGGFAESHPSGPAIPGCGWCRRVRGHG